MAAPSLASPIGRLRLVGMLEGASFLLLLGVAMPLKYAFGLPLAVKLVGWLHGLLFVGFVYVLSVAAAESSWSFKRVLAVFASGLVPFGPFVMDGSLRAEDERR
jgi:integral membrane protein